MSLEILMAYLVESGLFRKGAHTAQLQGRHWPWKRKLRSKFSVYLILK
jgi:hypothetical protein